MLIHLWYDFKLSTNRTCVYETIRDVYYIMITVVHFRGKTEALI